MTETILLAALWVLASTIVAFLPIRRQYVPGVMLLAAAPVLIVMLALQTHPVVGLAALLAFLSMYRNPLRYFWRKWRGVPVELPQ